MPPKQPAKIRLGRLQQIAPVDFWQEEADFIRWLAEAETLQMLSEALGLDLEPVNFQEAAFLTGEVAGLRCRDRTSQHPVVLVGQLQTTDDAHLGRLITEVSQDAPVAVWIASEIAPEHQAALAWLNRLGDADTWVAGVVVELWKIGKDAAANFKPIVYPEHWTIVDAETEAEAEAEPEPEPEPLSETQQENLDFWNQLCERLERRGSIVKAGAPVIESAMGFAIARAGFRLYAVIDREHHSLHSELLLSGEDAHPHFYLLAQEQDLIVKAIDLPLVWDDSDPKTCSIYCTLPETDINDRSRWKDYQQWLCDCLERFYEAFSGRIKQLDATDYQPLPDYGLNPLPNSLILPS